MDDQAITRILDCLKPIDQCHLCGSTDPNDKRTLGDRGAATHDSFQGDRQAVWAQPDLIKAIACRQCGLIYADPMPLLGASELDLLYNTAYFPSNEAVRPHHERLATILKHTGLADRPDLRYLEVGFGRGELLLAAHERGWRAEGVEIAQDLIDGVRAHVPGLPLHLGSLPELVLPSGEFDLILLTEVLEHVASPRQYLQAIHRLLKPDGRVYISVPNEGSLYFRLASAYKRWRDGSTYHLAPMHAPYHIYGFTRTSLSRLLEQEGFASVYYNARLSSASTGTSGLRKVVETGIFRLEKALNMGYCLELIAKKR